MKSFCTSLLLFLCCSVFAQTQAGPEPIDARSFPDSLLMCGVSEFQFTAVNDLRQLTMPHANWKTVTRKDCRDFIPVDLINKALLLRFTVANPADTAVKMQFIGGYYFRSMELYQLSPQNKLHRLPNQNRDDGFQPFIIPPGDTLQFIAAMRFTKRAHNRLMPQLVHDSYIVKYQRFHYYRNDKQLWMGFILSGVLLMMIFFTAATYLLTRKKEFLYNCMYSVCMFLLIFLNTFTERKSGVFPSLFREFFDLLLLAAGTVCYIAFTRKFLETDKYYPLLNRLFLFEEKFVLLFTGAFTYVVFATNNFMLMDVMENVFKCIVLLLGIMYIVIALAQKNKLMNYLAIGNAILIFFSIISLMLILFPLRTHYIFSSSMIYYELGIVSELICFLLGLIYKNRIELIEKTMEQEALKLEAEKRSYETKLAVLKAQQDERNRISADMHDDLGAGVTAIRLYSELAKKRMGTQLPEIEKISSSANELLTNMNAIIWTMSSSNDTLDNMVAYIRSYALEYFENTGIACRTHVDEDLPNIPVSGDIRRNVFLVVKEALNNILKHALATEVDISLRRVPEGISLYIQDNGKGIDMNNLRRFGNGLNNMRKRMEERHISFHIENSRGTLITLHYSLSLPVY